MRYKNKVFCDCCGKFIKKLDKDTMNFINQEWSNGTRVTGSYVYNKCAIKNDKVLRRKHEQEKKQLI